MKASKFNSERIHIVALPGNWIPWTRSYWFSAVPCLYSNTADSSLLFFIWLYVNLIPNYVQPRDFQLIYLLVFIVYLTTLLVSQIIRCRKEECQWTVNRKKMWNDVVVAWRKIPSRHFPRWTEENEEIRQLNSRYSAEIWTGDFPYKSKSLTVWTKLIGNKAFSWYTVVTLSTQLNPTKKPIKWNESTMDSSCLFKW
jgi:hypothetical protein